MHTDDTVPMPDLPALRLVEQLARMQRLAISADDLPDVLRQLQLVASHAQRVVDFDLDEETEPAGEFRP